MRVSKLPAHDLGVKACAWIIWPALLALLVETQALLIGVRVFSVLAWMSYGSTSVPISASLHFQRAGCCVEQSLFSQPR